MSGTVTDASGAIVADAYVRLTQHETGIVRSTSTNAAGIYRFDAVDLGVFELRISKPGFASFLNKGVIVESNRTTTIDSILQLGGSELVVQVNAAVEELLLKDSALRGGSFQAEDVSRLPLDVLNPISLTGMLPGAVAPSGTFVYGNGGETTQFAINGQRPRGNNYLLDGTDNNDLSFTGTAQPFNIADAVQEVSVQTSNFGAEFGRAGGGIVNVITKSGTNQLHGTLLWRFTSQAFNSMPSLNTSSGSTSPDFRENIYGFTVSGPITKNKTFFFAAFQQDRFRSPGQFS
ncbi:MAG: TonB-dependent receptor [Acidobacteria bacterium]|nr:TonB-dependent receptor [Acidobacteriota bacterium]